MLEKYGGTLNLTWAGEGAQTQRETIREYAAANGIDFAESPAVTAGWILAPREDNLARDIAALAWQRFRSGQFESAQALEAIYVRPSDAELKKNVNK